MKPRRKRRQAGRNLLEEEKIQQFLEKEEKDEILSEKGNHQIIQDSKGDKKNK